MGSFETCSPYRVHVRAFKAVNTLGKKGSERVDLSLMTVRAVANGEPLPERNTQRERESVCMCVCVHVCVKEREMKVVQFLSS